MDNLSYFNLNAQNFRLSALPNVMLFDIWIETPELPFGGAQMVLDIPQGFANGGVLEAIAEDTLTDVLHCSISNNEIRIGLLNLNPIHVQDSLKLVTIRLSTTSSNFNSGNLSWDPSTIIMMLENGNYTDISNPNNYHVHNTLTGIISNNTEQPVDYTLSQNYPNPFNPTTNISFSIPTSGLITLKVYNMAGMEVAKLLSENKIAGSYTIGFNAANLPSGTYFYKLETGFFTQTKKMLLIK